MANRDLANVPCAEAGCNKPRIVNKTGHVQTYCHEHQYLHMKEYEARRAEKNLAAGGVQPKQPKSCVEKGCSAPRLKTLEGHTYPRCEAHQKEYAAKHNRKRRGKQPSQMTEALLTEVKNTLAATEVAAKDAKLVCYIDHASDTMVFGELHITRVCKADVLNLPPLAWQAVIETITAKGYKIVERGTRPVSEVKHA